MAREPKHWSHASPLARECFLELAADPKSIREAEELADCIGKHAGPLAPNTVAARCGIDICQTDGLPAGVRGILFEPFDDIDPEGEEDEREVDEPRRLMAVPRSGKQANRALSILHESSHGIYERFGYAYSHADVWRLTLALGYPRSVVRQVWLLPLDEREAALSRLGHLPSWCAAARLEFERHRRRGAD